VELKDKIVSGAADMFMRYGVRSVTMDDVARELGMSKKTLYQSFENKDQLVMDTCRMHISQEMDAFGTIHNSAENAIDELHQLTSCMRLSMQKINPSLLFDLQKYHPDAWQIFLDFKFNFIQNQVKENLERGIEEGFYRREINADIMAKMRMEQVQTVFDPKVFPASTYDLIEVQMAVLDHFIHGLLSEQGRDLFSKIQSNLTLHQQ
jgi:AcrR family transcriptional regulator